jgi:hypothetical protein
VPKKKKTTTMLVRSVPLDVSERVSRYCRKEGLRYREFLEKAIDQFEGANQEQVKDSGQEERAQEKVDLIERVAKIAETVKAYKKAIRLKKDLIEISEDVGFLAKWEHEPHIYLEVVGMMKELDDIMEKSIPNYDIPDDPEKREAMGLPDKYCLIIKTAAEAEEIKRSREEADRRWITSPERKNILSEEQLREKMEKLKQQFRGENIMAGLKPDEDSAKPLTKEERNHFGVAATADPIQDPSEEDAESEPGKEVKKAMKFGEGSDDRIKGGGDE